MVQTQCLQEKTRILKDTDGQKRREKRDFHCQHSDYSATEQQDSFLGFQTHMDRGILNMH